MFRRFRSKHEALLLGAFTSAAAWCASALSFLLPGGPGLSKMALALAGGASLTPGLVMYFQAKGNSKQVGDLSHKLGNSSTEISTMSRQLSLLTAQFEEVRGEGEDAAAKRAVAIRSIFEISRALNQGTSIDSTEDSSDQSFFVDLLKMLRVMLGGDEGEPLGPLQVIFLRYVGDEQDLKMDEKARKVFLRRWGRSVGETNRDVAWEVFADEPDAEIARRLFNGTPPDNPSHIVPNVLDENYRNSLHLRIPQKAGTPSRSYCRVAVVSPHRPWGIICVDSWSDDPRLTIKDCEVVESFANILAVAFRLQELKESSEGKIGPPLELTSGIAGGQESR